MKRFVPRRPRTALIRYQSNDTASMQAYKELRKSQLANLDLYPLYTKSIPQSTTNPETTRLEPLVDGIKQQEKILEGRITGLRFSGKKLIFIDIYSNFTTKQAILNAKNMPLSNLIELKSQMQVGDVYQFWGFDGKNLKGLECFMVTKGRILAPCLKKIPLELKDVAVKHRLPYLNMLVDADQTRIFRQRSQVSIIIYKMIWKLRRELHDQGFEEVETPCLSTAAGGATAKPFETTLLTLNQPLYLRIAPELYLKRLVIGGYDKIFEIGKQFRNEGIDATHNPEFTTLELYWTYTDLNTMMDFTQDLIKKLVLECNNGHSTIGDYDFSAPFAIVDVYVELENNLGKLPDLNSEASIPELIDLAKKHNVDLGKSQSLAKIVDKLISELVESKLMEPTFLVGHPVCLSPLSKSHNGRAKRFELFIGGKEIANSYEELNDPLEQAKRFKTQKGNEDESYCQALEYGLPPCTGLGIGIDRLAMLICGTRRIKDVITFPIN